MPTIPGGAEWLIILVIFVLLFGAKKLPELSRSVGQSITSFKQGVHEAGPELPVQPVVVLRGCPRQPPRAGVAPQGLAVERDPGHGDVCDLCDDGAVGHSSEIRPLVVRLLVDVAAVVLSERSFGGVRDVHCRRHYRLGRVVGFRRLVVTPAGGGERDQHGHRGGDQQERERNVGDGADAPIVVRTHTGGCTYVNTRIENPGGTGLSPQRAATGE